MGKYCVYDSFTDDKTFHTTYEEALKEYEDAKVQILDDVVTGDEQVYIFEIKKVANLIENKERQNEAKEKGFDLWVEWKDSE